MDAVAACGGAANDEGRGCPGVGVGGRAAAAAARHGIRLPLQAQVAGTVTSPLGLLGAALFGTKPTPLLPVKLFPDTCIEKCVTGLSLCMMQSKPVIKFGTLRFFRIRLWIMIRF
jgi:hypothetical protein